MRTACLALLVVVCAACDTAYLFGRDPIDIDDDDDRDRAGEGEGEGEGEEPGAVCGGEFTIAASEPFTMGTPRTRHAAVLLADGRVLLAGGHDDLWETITSAEIFDPANDTFTPTGALLQARQDFALVALSDGRAVAFGGFNNDIVTPDDNGDLDTVEIWDPQTGEWTAGPAMPEPRSALSAFTADGVNVVVFGGKTNAESVPLAVLMFDASDNTLVDAGGDLTAARTSHTAVQLADGSALMIGGFYTESLSAVDRVMPDGRALSTPSIPGARRSACATLDSDGAVLVFGGYNIGALDDAQRFDASSSSWSSLGALSEPRFACEAVPTACGALICGGVDTTSCELDDGDRFVRVLDDVGAEFSMTFTSISDTQALVAGGFIGDSAVSDQARLILLQ